MNQIDGKAKNKATASAHIEKENIPPSTTPEWAIASHDHLLKSDLGKDWTACVQAWFELEQELGYGSQAGTKGALPFTTTRPQEWASWTSKSRGGVRNYQCTPSISDAAEFGIAIQGWWNSIQPSFRKSDTGTPTTIYSCPTGDQHAWVSLRKGGPNGLISLLTLLVWWGQSLAKQSQWQIDSAPDWKHMVLDVTKCLNAMKDSKGVAKSHISILYFLCILF
ncbi:hypothetical protein BYT27DRAFT_7230301 [Phlegmacium glaucopus]|nr:hypothetical protein BYT27DRAFT_7230301 [Phlegmacium glaucopus]